MNVLTGGIGDILGRLIGRGFERNDIRRLANDAREAGIHPLAALGQSTSYSQPSTMVPGNDTLTEPEPDKLTAAQQAEIKMQERELDLREKELRWTVQAQAQQKAALARGGYAGGASMQTQSSATQYPTLERGFETEGVMTGIPLQNDIRRPVDPKGYKPIEAPAGTGEVGEVIFGARNMAEWTARKGGERINRSHKGTVYKQLVRDAKEFAHAQQNPGEYTPTQTRYLKAKYYQTLKRYQAHRASNSGR